MIGPVVRRLAASRWVRLALRLGGGAAVLVAVVAQVGAGPFVQGLTSIDLRAVGAAVLLAAGATGAAAWRWRVIAARLGVAVSWPSAVGMYYQSQFLNAVLPGGVLGDVRRALRQGPSVGSVAQATRAVVIERIMGQLVQLVLTVAAVAWFALEFEGYLLGVVALGVAVIALAGLVVAASGRARAALGREFAELRAGVGSAGALAQVIAASVAVVACHVATFGVAAASVSASLPPLRLVAIALVVLTVGAIPLNLGGWGPREGAAGWAFGVAGMSVATGVAASTLFGVLALIAVAPGLVLLVVSTARRGAVREPVSGPAPRPATAPVLVDAEQHP